MKLLLIYPGIGVGDFGCKSGEGAWIHHGLGLIGTFIRSKGYDVDLLDMRNYSNWEVFTAELSQKTYDIVGISVSYADYHIAQRLIASIKQLNPTAKIVVGGYAPSIMPDKFDDWGINHLVIGEGELAMLDIVEGKPKPRIIKGDKIELDLLPYINRSFYNYPKEQMLPFVPNQPLPMVTMIAGRGCIFFCNYCQPAENILYGKPYRVRSVKHVIGELIELRNKYPFSSILFWDDTFTINKQWIYEFCDAYQANGFNQKIIACCRADIICNNLDMIKRLKEIGLMSFVIGIESGSQRMLDFLKKGTTVEQNKEAIAICHRLGIETFTTFMLGLPTETKEEQQATIDLIKYSAPDTYSLFYFKPIYGTEIYNYCVENDLILHVDQLNIDRTQVFKPTIKGIDYDYLTQLRVELMIYNQRKQQFKQIGYATQTKSSK